MNLNIIILAAGNGKRMNTELPKVMHKLGGLTLLERVVRTAENLDPAAIYVVYGNNGQRARVEMAHLNVEWVEQPNALGTGHAVQQVLPHLHSDDQILILYGDVPLISKQTLQTLLASTNPDELGLVVTKLQNPTGFGRIIRNQQGEVVAIVEQKDANIEQHSIPEVNTGIMTASARNLKEWLQQLKPHNAQNEYYLTDIIAIATANGKTIQDVSAQSNEEVRGINTLIELAQLERIYQRQTAERFMEEGVMIIDPNRFDVRGDLTAEPNVTIDINVIFEGNVTIGAFSSIGPHVILRNVKIGQNVKIESHCVIEDAELEDYCTVGPFARIRPRTRIGKHVRIGNFVEIKSSQLGEGSKVLHLSYIGDATIGQNVNIGAGTITVNYDGVNKHQTIIEDNAFVGCDSQLIAPVKIGEGAYIGAGSIVTADAPAHQLTIARARQRSIEGWKRKVKKETT